MKTLKLLSLIFILLIFSQIGYSQCCKAKTGNASTSTEVIFETSTASQVVVKSALDKVEGVSSYSVCPSTKKVSVQFDSKKTSTEKVKKALLVAGIQGVKESEACTKKENFSVKGGSKTN